MKRPGKLEFWQSASCLPCLVVVWRELEVLGPSEFSGGYISGRLFWVADKALFLLLLGLVLTFIFRRIAAVLLIVAALLILPLHLYLTFPGVIRKLTGVELSAAIVQNVIGDRWLIAGILVLLAMTYVCARNLSGVTGATSS